MALQPLAGDDPAEIAGYRLRGRLGAGGMARVYLAFTPGGRPVAVKVMRPDLGDDPEFPARFRQEIAAARQVSGLFTAQVLDADADGRPPWLVTAYVAGPSLEQAVAGHGPMPEQSVFWLVAGVAEALQAIHSAGLVHRDLKPSNVLLASDGPRVIDFGIARAVEATRLTRTGIRIGSPQFMAPEQIRGGVVSPAADVFALGALAAYAATGRPPFGQGDAAALLYRVVHQHPDLGGCPGRLRPLIEACLAKDPTARPAPPSLIEACGASAGPGTLESAHSWLPPAIAADLTGYDPPRALAAQYGVPPDPPTRPATAWAVAEPGSPLRRRRLSRTVLIAGVTAAVLAAALAGYGLKALAGSGTRASSAPDACLVGAWTGTIAQFPLTIEGQRTTFTGPGPSIVFRRDGVSEVEYGRGTALTAYFRGATLTAVFTGTATSRYTIRNGSLLGSAPSGNARYKVLDNGKYATSGPLVLPSTWSEHYTCSRTVLRLSMPGGESAELTRNT